MERSDADADAPLRPLTARAHEPPRTVRSRELVRTFVP